MGWFRPVGPFMPKNKQMVKFSEAQNCLNPQDNVQGLDILSLITKIGENNVVIPGIATPTDFEVLFTTRAPADNSFKHMP